MSRKLCCWNTQSSDVSDAVIRALKKERTIKERQRKSASIYGKNGCDRLYALPLHLLINILIYSKHAELWQNPAYIYHWIDECYSLKDAGPLNIDWVSAIYFKCNFPIVFRRHFNVILLFLWYYILAEIFDKFWTYNRRINSTAKERKAFHPGSLLLWLRHCDNR